MFETIKKDLINSMKEQDKFKLSVLRMLKSALQKEEINIFYYKLYDINN